MRSFYLVFYHIHLGLIILKIFIFILCFSMCTTLHNYHSSSDSLVLKTCTSYYLKSDILRRYNFKRFECCDPKNRRRKPAWISRQHQRPHVVCVNGCCNWEPHKSQHLHILFHRNTYSSFTQLIDWKYTDKLDKIFSRDFEILILILLKIYITQKTRLVDFKMANIIGKNNLIS